MRVSAWTHARQSTVVVGVCFVGFCVGVCPVSARTFTGVFEGRICGPCASVWLGWRGRTATYRSSFHVKRGAALGDGARRNQRLSRSRVTPRTRPRKSEEDDIVQQEEAHRGCVGLCLVFCV